jgi:hypothetical protein
MIAMHVVKIVPTKIKASNSPEKKLNAYSNSEVAMGLSKVIVAIF